MCKQYFSSLYVLSPQGQPLRVAYSESVGFVKQIFSPTTRSFYIKAAAMAMETQIPYGNKHEDSD